MPDLERRATEELFERGERAWPVGARDWEDAARAVLAEPSFDWLSGGAGEEWTLAANRAAFERRRLRPRVLAGTGNRTLAVELLGTTSPAPFLLAPIGGQTVAHPQGEIATAQAAGEAGVPMVVSTAASNSMEDIAVALGSTPGWYQLYWVSDDDVAASLARRAEQSGYRALVLTVDTPMVGWRDRDLRNAYIPFLRDEGVRQYTTDPVFRSRLAAAPEDDPQAAGAAMMAMFPNHDLTWDRLSWLREQTSLPILLKGILTAEDAFRAAAAGMDGVIVSNHGGRQLDGAVAALDALPEVRDALGPEAMVLMDSGIRRGTDVVKALALGADAVLLGRPYLYGLAVGGRAGVAQVLRTLIAEIDSALALVGARSPADLDSSFVADPTFPTTGAQVQSGALRR